VVHHAPVRLELATASRAWVARVPEAFDPASLVFSEMGLKELLG
jgi:hypothetical protein